jgi:hypothetical protein
LANKKISPDIKISKSLEWLRPYVEIIDKEGYVAPTKIKTYKTQVDKAQVQDAACYMPTKVIILNSHKRVKNGKKKFALRKYSKREILLNLSHELAHLTFWNHCRDHDELSKIFYKLFKKTGGE